MGSMGKEHGEQAIKLFNQMEQEGLEANDVTFLSLLYACSHCGLKDEGLELFTMNSRKELQKKFLNLRFVEFCAFCKFFSIKNAFCCILLQPRVVQCNCMGMVATGV